MTESKNKSMLKAALAFQQNEINEYHVYTRLAKFCRNPYNADLLRSLGESELAHAEFWRAETGKELAPDTFKVWKTLLIARIFGLTFTLKRMEKNEGTASKKYMEMIKDFPGAEKISLDEAEHEKQIISMLDEEHLKYMGSVVLGLNDALVELTGALAGFTFALGSTRLISLAGLITGVSASFSMSASEYLSCRAEGDPHAVKSAAYTGAAYAITVVVLILPFLLISSKAAALAVTLVSAIVIILVFNYYLAVAKDLDFKKRFAEMTLISLGVAALSFGVGYLLNRALGGGV